MKKQTFSEQVKKEICGLIFEDHCLKTLLSSFITSRLTIVLKSNQYKWRLTSQFPFIIEFIAQAFKTLYDVRIVTKINNKATNINGETNYLEVEGNFDQITQDLYLNTFQRDELCKLECCKRAYVAGAFLAGGSINSLDSKYYHLEIRSSD